MNLTACGIQFEISVSLWLATEERFVFVLAGGMISVHFIDYCPVSGTQTDRRTSTGFGHSDKFFRRRLSQHNLNVII